MPGGVPGGLHHRGLSAREAMALTLTPAAEHFVRRLLRLSGTPGGGLDLQVRPGGCTGYSARFDVAAQPAAGQTELTVSGLRLFLDARTLELLQDLCMDVADSPLQSGLVFGKPGAPGCGCAGAGATVAVSLEALRRR